MNFKLQHILGFLLIFSASSSVAQHYQFSQFYAAPTYLNPAFTGANACARVVANYRKQWNGLPGNFTTYQVSADHYLPQVKGGIGVQFFKDEAGTSNLNTTAFSALYAYETKITRSIAARAGISAGLVQRKIDLNNFTFADQISRGESVSTVERIDYEGVNYFDVGTGALIYTREAWFGLAVAHLNKPDQSLLFEESALPREWKMHGGYRILFDGKPSTNKNIPVNNFITLVFNYKHQNKFNQLDFGLYYSKNFINLGVWYRGIPLFKPVPGYLNNDALVSLIGFNMERFKIGYSYDLTLSNLSNVTSKGSHEISLSYQFCKMPKAKNRKKRLLISCPKF